MESLPRTEQSLGTPQQHAVYRTPRQSPYETTTSGRPVGPDLAVLKPASKPTKTAPKPISSARRVEPTPTLASKSRPEPKPGATKPKSSGSDQLNKLKRAATKLAKKAGVEEEAEKLITEATPAAESLAMKSAGKSSVPKLDDMKVEPRTLIASLEKYVPLSAEQLIGEDMDIDLDGVDLEPPTAPVEHVARADMPKTTKAIENPGAVVDAGPDSPEDTNVNVGSNAGTEDHPPTKGSRAIQPLGLSFFERFALSTMIASENHLAMLERKTPTKPIPTAPAEGDEARPPTPEEPAEVEEEGTVPFVANDIPPSNVNPGLDEMVISSTSQTDFDLNDSEMAFIGNVQVKSPRFNLRSDKFIVHLKSDNSGMAYGEALGNVVIEMRENGRPTGHSGLASKAIYDPGGGKITLSGWPKIRQQFKEHVAVTRDTKMILYTDGRVKTLGRNRTVIRKR